MSPEIIRSISLYSDANGSDKVYNVQMVKVEDGYVINYQNGARCGRMTLGTKTPAPIDLVKAEKKFDSLVKEKMNGSSRYRIEESNLVSGVYIPPAPSRTPTNQATMMLSVIRDASHRNGLLNDPMVVCEEKHDGYFLKLIVKNGEVTGSAKKAFETSVNPLHAKKLLASGKTFTIDCESVGDHLYIFECPSINGAPPLRTYQERKAALALLGLEDDTIHIVKSSGSVRASKVALMDAITARGGEGWVFKRQDAPYEDGISANMVKDPIYASATMVVVAHNKTARSVQVGAHDQNGVLVTTNSVTIPSNHAIPALQSIVEIVYPYANPNTHALLRSVYKGPRLDLDLVDCVLSQLRYKVGAEHEMDDASDNDASTDIDAPAKSRRKKVAP